MKKVIYAILSLALAPSAFASSQIDQICRDGIGSKATVSVDGKVYSVKVEGPASDEFIKRGLFYSEPVPQVNFKSTLQTGPWGTRIMQSDQYLTNVASWEGSALIVRVSKSKEQSLTWRFDECRQK